MQEDYFSLKLFHFILIGKVVSLGCAASIEQNNKEEKFNFRQNEIDTTEDIIRRAGYQAESHYVSTEDSHFIKFYRIPFGKIQESNQTIRPIVILQHGMLCSSSDWVFAGPKRGLGFILADLGYDVWLTNVRGNIYGRNHTYGYHAGSRDFSFHEMGKYDIPAQIDYILNVTYSPELYYIGHSMGTTAFYVMLSIKPEYNRKVRAMISLAPIAYLQNVRGLLIKIIKWLESVITKLLKLFNIQIVFPRPIKFSNYIFGKHVTEYIERILIGLLCGFNSDQYDEEMVSSYLAHVPAGTSWKVAQHYFQIMNSDRFHEFDYGPMENKIRYGTTVAPRYKLENIKVPVVLINGRNDYLSVEKDVVKLQKSLNSSPVVITLDVDHPYFSHLDFMWAKDIYHLLHERIIEILELFQFHYTPPDL